MKYKYSTVGITLAQGDSKYHLPSVPNQYQSEAYKSLANLREFGTGYLLTYLAEKEVYTTTKIICRLKNSYKEHCTHSGDDLSIEGYTLFHLQIFGDSESNWPKITSLPEGVGTA